MDEDPFVQYWYNEDVNDGKVCRLIQNADELTVEIDTRDRRRVTFEFSGVESVIRNSPEGMLTALILPSFGQLYFLIGGTAFLLLATGVLVMATMLLSLFREASSTDFL
jgi:hypothetical protein